MECGVLVRSLNESLGNAGFYINWKRAVEV